MSLKSMLKANSVTLISLRLHYHTKQFPSKHDCLTACPCLQHRGLNIKDALLLVKKLLGVETEDGLLYPEPRATKLKDPDLSYESSGSVVSRQYFSICCNVQSTLDHIEYDMTKALPSSNSQVHVEARGEKEKKEKYNYNENFTDFSETNIRNEGQSRANLPTQQAFLPGHEAKCNAQYSFISQLNNNISCIQDRPTSRT
ncbi:hypothetical protein BKA65DRAFT_492982 [Rhexocercosporidium sp. MPI-PUGE-AT-0058]|nr:hypothetical protein BKA65DRAFT_492982 [Rhexocercosporidium sp. MPI-PUGE-AT-0058]